MILSLVAVFRTSRFVFSLIFACLFRILTLSRFEGALRMLYSTFILLFWWRRSEDLAARSAQQKLNFEAKRNFWSQKVVQIYSYIDPFRSMTFCKRFVQVL